MNFKIAFKTTQVDGNRVLLHMIVLFMHKRFYRLEFTDMFGFHVSSSGYPEIGRGDGKVFLWGLDYTRVAEVCSQLFPNENDLLKFKRNLLQALEGWAATGARSGYETKREFPTHPFKPDLLNDGTWEVHEVQ